MATNSIPTLLAPAPVAEASRKLRAFAIERRALSEGRTTAETTRRRAALGLLVTDARTALTAAVDEHKATWTEALTSALTVAEEAYAANIADLDQARADTTAASHVLDWLTDAGYPPRQFRALPQPRLAKDTPWPAVIGALRTEAGNNNAPAGDTPNPVPVFAINLSDTVASFPELDMPDAITDTYNRHRDLLGQHQALGIERRRLEDGRKDAQTTDQREYADSIANGTKDPGDRHVAKLDDQIADLDRQRAGLSVDIRDTHAALLRLLREHRDTWRATVTRRHAEALNAYTSAVTQLPDTRAAMHATRAALRWLTNTTATDLGDWTPNDKPPLAGRMVDELYDQLRRDLAAQRRYHDTPTSGTAA